MQQAGFSARFSITISHDCHIGQKRHLHTFQAVPEPAIQPETFPSSAADGAIFSPRNNKLCFSIHYQA
ncbi:hypothetical protein DAQ1742_02512 [Dickeya aquatica]|uniref:Uncharacterized protein n=1 Tax=Dickeya aquatica TaxID=1401087 RepID=A0A375ABR7_9GAMM|nr:hypothetical protein DAQ1742_02512 [Dickeya aquatica]